MVALAAETGVKTQTLDLDIPPTPAKVPVLDDQDMFITIGLFAIQYERRKT